MRAVAYTLQEQVHGGLSKAARRRLRALAQAFAETGRVAPDNGTKVRPRHTAGARMAGPDPCRHRDGKRLRLRRGGLWFLDRYRPTHHGRALVRSSLLRPAAFRRERIGGGAWLSIGNHHERRVRPRCAAPFYTRKSSEEGLEQDFNSLQAQREACEAYIASQKHEGWIVLPTFYDDGGVSGATLERPALQRLLADVEVGRDRHDRRLQGRPADPDAVGFCPACGDLRSKERSPFVSVTQQFNTTTSMGRLTLNVLLSFAQFEREVTGERIRDKIAASKRKGCGWAATRPWATM